jgi:putative two-component system response regulator
MFDLAEVVKRLLIVDDDELIRKTLLSFFSTKYLCEEADSAESALEMITRQEFSVILSDVVLPQMDGIEMIREVRKISPQSEIIMISGKDTADFAIKSFRAGAFDYFHKPFDFSQLENSVEKAVEHYELKCLKNNYQCHLESLVAERTTEVDKALEEVENSYRTTLKALVQALETRDFETHGHSERVVTFSLRLGYELGLDKPALRHLELGALLHDIGKIGVPDAILRKPAKLTEEEWDKMKLHPLHGQKIMRNIPFLEGAAKVVAQHHEKWDGTGYPYQMRGEEIDIGARIFSVVDAFDAMISDRVYRKGRPYEAALEELKLFAGTQFDPVIVEAFKKIPKEDWETLRERSLVESQDVFSFQAFVAEMVYARQQFELVH